MKMKRNEKGKNRDGRKRMLRVEKDDSEDKGVNNRNVEESGRMEDGEKGRTKKEKEKN